MKSLKLIPFLALLALIVSACNAPKTNSTTLPDTTATASLSTDTADHSIDIATARRLVKNFDVRASKVHKDGKDDPDTRCVWFSKDRLKSLLKKIDAEGGDGIRFYLATYDKKLDTGDKTLNTNLKKIDPDYWDYSTLVMVSTRKALQGGSKPVHYDYYSDALNPTDAKYVSEPKKRSGSIIMAIPENEGELCPPPAKCNTVGARLLEQ